ncbi:hypothetical protein ACD591_06965 [Rufibacter glacialis]|uniref:Uncharacterized protein n=1 Tax=Rufibacter glacialis TaxID=1259555 RepID=A0A5M8QE75_9BACT|nr:hypothetical protein [Rufibacter glacialis]KAA6433391.1 hypothetical protein FOE74_13015 [Rufibacter glacialis]GGK74636.1 hypothetical protein GCM10011405_23340 [Rufibacter glacialis]
MTLLDLVLKVKINFKEGYIQPTNGGALRHNFEISPKEFLSFSKQDFKIDDKRGRVNALSNAKRAIDCQIDKIFWCFGMDPAKYPDAVNLFIKSSNNVSSRKDIKPQLMFLQAMGFAPASIIANTRNLRHKLEHYYKAPSYEQVSEAIDLAELFISATDSKLVRWDYIITDNENLENDGVKVKFDADNYLFKIYEYRKKGDSTLSTDREEDITFKNNQVEFFHLMKIATSLDYETDIQEALVDLLEFIKHPIPKQHIRIGTELM